MNDFYPRIVHIFDGAMHHQRYSLAVCDQIFYGAAPHIQNLLSGNKTRLYTCFPAAFVHTGIVPQKQKFFVFCHFQIDFIEFCKPVGIIGYQNQLVVHQRINRVISYRQIIAPQKSNIYFSFCKSLYNRYAVGLNNMKSYIRIIFLKLKKISVRP